MVEPSAAAFLLLLALHLKLEVVETVAEVVEALALAAILLLLALAASQQVVEPCLDEVVEFLPAV